jgi:hypothetical protein
MTAPIPRGVRLNNPGNLKYDPAVRWQGLDSPTDDGTFCRFLSPKWGIRAMARVLIAYQDKHNIRTVNEIVQRWAPAVENDTGAYIRHLASEVGVDPTQPINLHDPRWLRPLVIGIIRHENGMQPYTDAQIDAGLVLAGIEPERAPLAQSRTVRGGQLAGVGTLLTAAGEALEPLKEQVAWLAPYWDGAKWFAVAVIAVGVVGMLYARWDDRRKGLR